MFIISAPSGGGKTTVTQHILSLEKNIELSISVTTRPPRPSETEGREYYFVDEDTFLQRLQGGYFLEYATVYGHYYGTPREGVEKKLQVGIDVLFDIDWQGARQLKAIAPDECVSIFLLPPSLSSLRDRLGKRGQDGDEIIACRMEKALEEIEHYKDYDYVVVNADLEETMGSVRAILQAERLKRVRQRGLPGFIERICPEGTPEI